MKVSLVKPRPNSTLVYLTAHEDTHLNSMALNFETVKTWWRTVEVFPCGPRSFFFWQVERPWLDRRPAHSERAVKLLRLELQSIDLKKRSPIYFKVPKFNSPASYVVLFDFIKEIDPYGVILPDDISTVTATQKELDFYKKWFCNPPFVPQQKEAFLRVFRPDQIRLETLEEIVQAHKIEGNFFEAMLVQEFLKWCPQAERAEKSCFYQIPEIIRVDASVARKGPFDLADKDMINAIFSAESVTIEIYSKPLAEEFPTRISAPVVPDKRNKVSSKQPFAPVTSASDPPLKTFNESVDWRGMTGHEFESRVADSMEKKGWKVEVTQKSGDHGIDIRGHDGKGQSVAIQCKQWKGKAGEKEIRDFKGSTVNAFKRKIFLCTGGYSLPAYKYAYKSGIEIWGHKELNEFLQSDKHYYPKYYREKSPKWFLRYYHTS